MDNLSPFCTSLHLACKSLQFYAADHPRSVEALTALERAIDSLLADRSRVAIAATKGTLMADGTPITPATPAVRSLASDLEKRQIGGFVLTRGATQRELTEFVRVLNMKPAQLTEAGGPEEALRRADVMHIRMSRVRYEAVTEGEEVVWSKSVRHEEVPDAERADDGLDLLRGRIEELGMSREQVDELVHIIGWDKLNAEEKVQKLLDGDTIFTIPSDKLIAFVRELLAARRYDDALSVLERYAAGMERDSFSLREGVTDVFGQIAAMIESPGVSPEIEQLIVRTALTRCTRETDPRLHRSAAEAAANLIAATAATARCDAAHRVFARLQAATRVAPADAPVHETFRLLLAALGEPRRANSIIGQIVSADADSLGRNVVPLVVDLGAALAPALIEALASEEDRNRRGRLVKALKALGKPAYPSLLDALQSPAWYVVRNALMVLGDIGTPTHIPPIAKKLEHGEPRVRRAAARALAKIGGPEAERHLAAALADRNPEMQNEVLLCLGSMRAASAVPAVIHVAKSRLLGGDEKLREVAIATLGQIGSDAAIEFLAEIVRPKSMFNRESLPIRSAAATALAGAPTMSGRMILQSALAAETDAASREMLAASLARTQ